MSIYELNLNIFKFDAHEDYTAFYEKRILEYNQESTLLDILKSIPNLEFEEKIALKLNSSAIFEDLRVVDLVGEFGKDWVLEPISKLYALKDLVIDKKMALSFYDRFLQAASFLTKNEKDELVKFININFISPQRNPEYFGDGFFLYVKWLFMRHPNEIKRLLKSIAIPQNGVMNFVSVKDFLFPKSDKIDQEIFGIQQMLTQASKCPFSGGNWKKFARNIESKYNLPYQPKAPLPEPTKRTYAIFNGYNKKFNAKPLLLSTQALLKKWGKSLIELDFCYDGGYWGRFCDVEKFLLSNAYNMALASKGNAVLVLADEDSYANITYARKLINSDLKLLESINLKLKKYGLTYRNDIEFIWLNEMIATNFDWEVLQSFGNFSSLLFGGSFASNVDKICYEDFFSKISLKRHILPVQNECYAHLFAVNKDSCLTQTGAILYEGIDLGTDFLMSASLMQFEMLDSYAKKASKYYKRDFIPTPVLLLPQVSLLAMGEKNPKKLGFHWHKNKINFI